MPESVQSCFELSIYLSLKRTSRELLLKIARGKKYREMYWKVQSTTGRFLAQLHPSNFFLKILLLLRKGSISCIFQSEAMFLKMI